LKKPWKQQNTRDSNETGEGEAMENMTIMGKRKNQ